MREEERGVMRERREGTSGGETRGVEEVREEKKRKAVLVGIGNAEWLVGRGSEEEVSKVEESGEGKKGKEMEVGVMGWGKDK